jgi:hypothetical protein
MGSGDRPGHLRGLRANYVAQPCQKPSAGFSVLSLCFHCARDARGACRSPLRRASLLGHDFTAIPQFHWQKAPAEEDRQALTARGALQLMGRTSYKNYITLTSYQPLLLQHRCVKIHALPMCVGAHFCRLFAFAFLSRTPGPPSFGSMNSTPAFAKAVRMASTVLYLVGGDGLEPPALSV